jgi:branched-chain amino acid transport system permease protein
VLVRHSGRPGGRADVMRHVAATAQGLFLVGVLFVLVELCLLVFDTSVVVLALIDIVAVVGLWIFMGNSGIFNFGHPAFLAIGAYVGSWVTMGPTEAQIVLPHLPHAIASLGLNLYAGCAIVAAVGALLGLLLSIPLVRLTALGAAIASIGVLVIARDVMLGAHSYTNGAETFYGTPLDLTLWKAFAVAAVSVVIARWFRASSVGLTLRAARDNEDAAVAAGVHVARARSVAYALSGAVGAVAGILYAHDIGAFGPTAFYFELAFTFVAMLIAGGRFTVSGAIVGVFVITALTQLLHSIEAGVSIGSIHFTGPIGLTQIGISASLLAVMYWRPTGLIAVRELDELAIGLLRRLRSRRNDAPAVRSPRTESP